MPLKYQLFDHLIEGVQVVDFDWRYIYVNKSSAIQLNCSASDILGKELKSVFPILNNSAVEVLFKHCLVDRKDGRDEVQIIFPRGIKKWYDLKVIPIPEGMLIMTADITERKRSQAAFMKKERNQNEVLEKMKEAYMVLKVIRDESGHPIDMEYVIMNTRAALLFGQSRETLVGLRMSDPVVIESWRYMHSQKEIQKMESKLNEVIDTQLQVTYFSKLKKFNMYGQVMITPLANDRIAMMAIDITERKRAEHKLSKLNNRLTAIVEDKTKELVESLDREKIQHKIKSDYLSMVSHELKAPLASIKVCLDMLNKQSSVTEDKTVAKYKGYIHDEVDNLLSMVNEFISPTNRILSQTKGYIGEVELVEFVGGIVDGISVLASHDQKILHKHEGKSSVKINKDLVRRILLNLLSNAVKYSKDIIELNTKVTKTHFLLSVRDKGIGIPTSDQDNLFTKFFRAENTDGILGTGLGLTIVKSYVEMLNGTIEFESTENVGSKFTVLLPFIKTTQI